MKKLSLALLPVSIFCMLYACGGSGNSNDPSAKSDLEPVKASINLRLGQVSKSSSPVAVSAALENGESIVLFNREGDSNSDFEVAYKNAADQLLLVTFDQTGRPKSGQARDAIVSFSNYTKNTVDITIKTGTNLKADSSRTFINQPIDPDSLAFLDSDIMIKILLGLDNDRDSGIRGLLAPAFSSLKIVGCLSDNILSQFQNAEGSSPEIFSAVTSGICNSQLLSSVNDILNKSNYQEITVTGLDTPASCNTPLNFDSFEACSIAVGDQNVIASENGYVNEFPRPTPTPTDDNPTESPSETPTPALSPSPPPPLPPNINLGAWTGIGTGSTSQTGCRNFTIDFVVVANGDSSCTPPTNCVFDGTFNDDEKFLSFSIHGEMDNIGHFVFAGHTVTANGVIDLMSDGNFSTNGLRGGGNFTHNFLMCTGVTDYKRPE